MKKQKKKRVTIKFKFIILIIILAYCGIMFINQAIVAASQKEAEIEYLRQLAELEYQNNYLKNKLEYINSDEYYEEAARTRFGWVKPGERIYINSNE